MPETPTPESQIPAFSPGHDLAGRYRLIESLANSWSEETWSAYDVQTNSQVALHVLPFLFVAEQQGLHELRQRGARLQALPHPGLIRSLDFFVTPEAACYVTELLRGSSLAELRHRHPDGVYQPGEIIDWLGGAIAALRHLHSFGWAHGDLHPGQMLIDPGGRLRLTGLGIAQIVSEVHFPEGGSFALAHSCKSPQQLNGEMAAPPDDLYALGASIFHLLTGQLVTSPLLFRPPSAALPPMGEVCARLGLLERTIDPAWDRLVQQCLAARREERPTLDRVTELLLALKLQTAAAPTPPSALQPPSGVAAPAGFAPLLPPVPPSPFPGHSHGAAVEEAPLAAPVIPPSTLVPPTATAPPPEPEAAEPAAASLGAPSVIELPELERKSTVASRLGIFLVLALLLGGGGSFLWQKTQRSGSTQNPLTTPLATPESEWSIVEDDRPPGTPKPVATAATTPRSTPRPLSTPASTPVATPAPPPSTPSVTPLPVATPMPIATPLPRITPSATPSAPTLRGNFRPPLVPQPPSLPTSAATPAAPSAADSEQALLEQSRRATGTRMPPPGVTLPPLRALSENELSQISRRLWKNEGAGTATGLTAWRPGEPAPTFGIGRFAWHPPGATVAREETFPDLMQYLAGHGVTVPAWLNGPCPWATRDRFFEDFTEPRMTVLRELLKSTVPQQTRLLTERLPLTVGNLLSTLPGEERTQVETQYNLLARTPRGIFAMVDYLTLQGPGSAGARGAAPGLLQALLDNKGTSVDDAADRFSDAAERVLLRRPPANEEQRRERIARVRGYSAEW